MISSLYFSEAFSFARPTAEGWHYTAPLIEEGREGGGVDSCSSVHARVFLFCRWATMP
jgi:hypothetical protein